jgi:hypothetical protein
MSNTDKTNDNSATAGIGLVFHAQDISAAEADRLLASLGVPLNEASRETLRSLGMDADRNLDLLITDAVAEQIWIDWNRDHRERIEDDGFRRALRTMLAEGARVGIPHRAFPQYLQVAARPGRGW